MIKEAVWMLRYTRSYLFRKFGLWPRDLAAWRRFWRSYRNYRKLAPPERQPSVHHLYPCIADDTVETPIEPIYFYQDSWAFEKIVKQLPKVHVDVGSNHKFVALLSKVLPVIMVDIRPLSLPLASLTFKKGTILNLPFADASVPSASSLCVIEHIGLGRFGDPLDAYGTEKAISELKRVVAPGGDLYLSVPLDDDNRIYFNAHRAFNEEYLLSLFKTFEIVERRYIYGRTFSEQPGHGFGIGCYWVRSTR